MEKIKKENIKFDYSSIAIDECQDLNDLYF